MDYPPAMSRSVQSSSLSARLSLAALFALALLAPACGSSSPVGGAGPDASAPPDPWRDGPALGARQHQNGDLEFRVEAPRATRVEVALFAAPIGEAELLRLPLDGTDGTFSLRIGAADLAAAGLSAPYYYGYRVFGDNWTFDPAWEPGSELGLVTEIDSAGNRMNPNKLVIDPYALELSHDPANADHSDMSVFLADADHRAKDSGPWAPKGVILPAASPRAPGPARPIGDEVVYEVHLRGLTMSDPSVPEELRGTYAGAAYKARYLADLGVTAIELLPLHETFNDQNDLTEDAEGDNYWGYSSLSYFAPDRRYAADKSPGGPTREIRAMIDAFHGEGIKVYADVVYNHFAEGSGSMTLSLRGLDNATFYELTDDHQGYVISNGVSANVNVANPVVGDLVLASLKYWHEDLGFDGFRFDLAAVVGNSCTRDCYGYSKDGLLKRISGELGRDDAGAGADLIAEPWGVVAGSYQVGNFPAGWSEWNDKFRDTVRRDLNRLGQEVVTPRELATRISGSADLFADDGRTPAASINYVNAHDGFTLADLFSYDTRQNDQPWPYGPSNGGSSDELQSSHGGDPVRQKTAARTALALVMLSAGVPMLTGGDEFLRSQHGNNNAYNIDSVANWLTWEGEGHDGEFLAYARGLFAFRARHAAFRPRQHWSSDRDGDGDGRTEVRWLEDSGSLASAAYLDAGDRHFLAYELDGDDLGDSASAIFVAYNGWSDTVNATLPAPPTGYEWRKVGDTSPAAAAWGYWIDPTAADAASAIEPIGARSLAVFETVALGN